ncbi:hypothetical protein [Natronospira bacteriovora]|uniref:HEPN AbiU2-like domain-containing protein n=1 Tax=Natronospira bacteriovora TaxID=3069753 RepID=A0ABU0W9P9_9GAMM|nr:hypothetical protein [Natronospira sp. AB-CW4]MDQ2070483.1 hypothetical protein [Natronospira sp. AB-CW4]
MDWTELKQVASWGHYVHWAQLNGDRWICAEDETPAESLAISFQFFASMYVAIEGWQELKLQDSEIDRLLMKHQQGVALLKRARNAVYHFQKEMYGDKMVGFAEEIGRDGWVLDLYHEFVRFLAEYPKRVCPFEEKQDHFAHQFYEILGWEPER